MSRSTIGAKARGAGLAARAPSCVHALLRANACDQSFRPESAMARKSENTAAPPRCAWPGEGDPLYLAYHDEEWGVPLRDDRALFEMLVLEGAQAGLSWITILKRREGYRRAFEGFDPQRIARYGKRDVNRLLADTGIIRNRAK